MGGAGEKEEMDTQNKYFEFDDCSFVMIIIGGGVTRDDHWRSGDSDRRGIP